MSTAFYFVCDIVIYRVSQKSLCTYRGRFWESHLQGSSSPLTLEDGTDRLSRNVGNYESTLRNIPEERRSPLHRGGNLKSRVVQVGCRSNWRGFAFTFYHMTAFYVRKSFLSKTMKFDLGFMWNGSYNLPAGQTRTEGKFIRHLPA
jgi:hypothetical protein